MTIDKTRMKKGGTYVLVGLLAYFTGEVVPPEMVMAMVEAVF